MNWQRIFSISFIVVSATHCTPPQDSSRLLVSPEERTLIFGHRGLSSIYDENTVTAIAQALLVADGAEIDIQLTKDRIPFVLHDDTLRRTATPYPQFNISDAILDRHVGELEWNEIKNVIVGPNQENVPRLENILDLYLDNPDKQLLIEIKPYQDTEVERLARRHMVEALDVIFAKPPYNELKSRMIFISFDEQALHLLKDTNSLADMKRFWLWKGAMIETALKEGNWANLLERAMPFTGIDMESGPYLYKKISEAQNLVAELKSNGKEVISWINRGNRTDGRHWLTISQELGINVFTSDLPPDIIYQNRWNVRLNQTISFLNQFGTASIEGPTGSIPGDFYFEGKPIRLYSPIGFDFIGLDSAQIEKILLLDINHLQNQGAEVLVNLIDLTSREIKSVLPILNKLPDISDIQKMAILGPSQAHIANSSIVDAASAIVRLEQTLNIDRFLLESGTKRPCIP